VGAVQARSDSGRSAEDREKELRTQVRLAAEEALSKGVTSFHDAGSSFSTIDFFKRLESEGALPVRLYVMVRRESNATLDQKLPQYFMPIEGDDYLTVRSIKRQIDGALGSHGAWLLEPYVDLPESHGLTLETPEDIEGTAEVAIKHGFQVNTHAIGDRANRVVLDIYERVFRKNPEKKDLRWRIDTRSTLIRQMCRVSHSWAWSRDAGHACHVRRTVDSEATRRGAVDQDVLRVPGPNEDRRDHQQRHRCTCREHRSDRELLCGGVVDDEHRQVVQSRSANDARRSAANDTINGAYAAFRTHKGSLVPGNWPTSRCRKTHARADAEIPTAVWILRSSVESEIPWTLAI
jgi:hypothetical protein